jgi:chromosome segregation ATPase
MTPEEQELQRIEADIDELKNRLARAEEALANRTAVLAVFRARYRKVIAPLKAQSDRLEAELAAFEAAIDPSTEEVARDRRERAWAAEEIAKSAPESVLPKPTEDLRELFRHVARLAHPDLGHDDVDRERRTRLMQAANEAYRSGDGAMLERIAAEASDAPPTGDSIGERLVSALRRRAAATARLQAIDLELTAFDDDPLAELNRRVVEAEEIGRDLLGEMAQELERRSASLKELLDARRKPVKQAEVGP